MTSPRGLERGGSIRLAFENSEMTRSATNISNALASTGANLWVGDEEAVWPFSPFEIIIQQKFNALNLSRFLPLDTRNWVLIIACYA